MPQADFAYDVAGLSGTAISVSIFADRDDVRSEMRDDAVEGGLVLRECGTLESLAEGNPRALGDAVLIDCPFPDAGSLAALCRMDSRIARSGAHLIVSTTFGGLEDVFACLSQSQPEILVSPRRAERIVALGRVFSGGVGRRVRELSADDRLSLIRLTEQVNRIAQKLERFTEVEPDAFGEASSLRSPATAFRFGDAPPAKRGAGGNGDRLVRGPRPALPDARLVRRIIQQRQMRAKFFEGDLFADPAWDMLLDLTAARAERVRVSVTSLCIAASVPATTALRWISQLTASGLFERTEDENDRRRAFIQLSDKACDLMARYFAAAGSDVMATV
jgi:hypothetical protein